MPFECWNNDISSNSILFNFLFLIFSTNKEQKCTQWFGRMLTHCTRGLAASVSTVYSLSLNHIYHMSEKKDPSILTHSEGRYGNSLGAQILWLIPLHGCARMQRDIQILYSQWQSCHFTSFSHLTASMLEQHLKAFFLAKEINAFA